MHQENINVDKILILRRIRIEIVQNSDWIRKRTAETLLKRDVGQTRAIVSMPVFTVWNPVSHNILLTSAAAKRQLDDSEIAAVEESPTEKAGAKLREATRTYNASLRRTKRTNSCLITKGNLVAGPGGKTNLGQNRRVVQRLQPPLRDNSFNGRYSLNLMDDIPAI